MNNLFCKWVPAMLLVSLLSASASAQVKMATVDLHKVFDGYWKKKQAEAQIKERAAGVDKEYKNMLADYTKAKEDYQNLMAGASDTTLSTEERDRRKKSAEDKLKHLRDLEESIKQYDSTMKVELNEQANRLRSNILTDIKNVVRAKAQTAGFSMVVDTSAESGTATPIFLYVTAENDITDSILLQLNATAPVDTSRPDDMPAVKPLEKKKESKK
jgi:outer membrane protein